MTPEQRRERFSFYFIVFILQDSFFLFLFLFLLYIQYGVMLLDSPNFLHSIVFHLHILILGFGHFVFYLILRIPYKDVILLV